MRDKKRVVIVEDHAIIRNGLRALLQASSDLDVVGEARDGREAIRFAGELAPDLILTDLSMPGISGLDVIREIRRRYPDIKIIALTVHKTEEYIVASLEAGANGYVVKDANQEELMAAVSSVLAGNTYLSPQVTDKVVSAFLAGRSHSQSYTPWDMLTERERQVLKLVAEGHTNKAIADYLFISVKTVEKHRASLMRKLNLHNAPALTAFAMEKGLIAR
jgi:DNA-binding NarL/FixJ family response regulator